MPDNVRPESGLEGNGVYEATEPLSGEYLRREMVNMVQQIKPDYFKSKRWFGSK